jgi:hypothetical protein
LEKNPDKAEKVAVAAKKLATSIDFEDTLSDAVSKLFGVNYPLKR